MSTLIINSNFVYLLYTIYTYKVIKQLNIKNKSLNLLKYIM